MWKPVIAVLCGACVLAGSAGSAGRSPTCASGKIAFQRTVFRTNESGSEIIDVWVVRADGSGQRNLTGGDSEFEGRPAWSPDGRSIAYTSSTGTNTMNASGGQVHRVTRIYSWDPTWSPDGRTLAVASDNSPVPGTRVGVVNARGGSVRWITRKGLDSGEPDWSSNGPIAFVQRTGYADVTMELFVMSSAGTAKRRLTRNREQEATPAWSPDGTRIAYHTKRGIYIMNADGTGAQRLTRGREDYEPTWSPDGRCIAFSRYGRAILGGGGGNDIFVVSVADGALRRLMTHKPNRSIDGAPAWSAGAR